MKTFSKEVNLKSKSEMINFLKNHFRYWTMNPWNRSTSYAHNVKLYNLGLTREQEDKAYEMMETEEFYDDINWLIRDFEEEHDYKWQAGFNGHSGGYLVLYSGGKKDSGYKSRCTECGQLNYKTVEETGDCRCGRCGVNARRNLEKPVYNVYSQPGLSIDEDEDFEEWSLKSLKERVKIVQEFDQLCDNILAAVVNMTNNYHVEEEEILVPQTRKTIKENS